MSSGPRGPLPPVSIRAYRQADTIDLAGLFRASVHSVPQHDYSSSQARAWASTLIDEVRFGERCASKSTWIAEIEGRIVGFSDLESDGHIDLLYVHPDFQRRGVARALLEHIESTARESSLPRLYTEASITARPVFEARGFHVIAPQTVTVGGESMINYRMEKRFGPRPAGP